jgi:murein DD-endopeptidase MepM/ murein hydrolase activator NlpD
MRLFALPLLFGTAAITGAAAPLPVVIATPLQAVQGQILLATLPAGSHDLTIDGAPLHVERDGRFMAGVDRDFAGTRALAWVTADGRSARRDVQVRPREWDIDRLPARLLRPADPDAPPNLEYEAQRAAEVRQVRAARAIPSDYPFWRAAFIWPAQGRVSTHFGSQRFYGDVAASYHGGMDIAAPRGTPIVAPIPGVVRLAAGPFSLEGNIIILDHGRGLHSVMLHLSKIDVTVGQIVRQGEKIGEIGTTGRSTGPHLHWGLTLNGVKVDPEPLLPPAPAKAAA